MDRMEIYEIDSLMKYNFYNSKDNWEQARLIAFLQAQTHTNKRLKVEDIIKFPWEDDKLGDALMTDENFRRLAQQAAEIEKMMAQQQK